jgi:glycine cleavage system aminomethyltransferase T
LRRRHVSPIETLKYFTFDRVYLAAIPCTIGRLGYTGEAGFEIIVDRARRPRLREARIKGELAAI